MKDRVKLNDHQKRAQRRRSIAIAIVLLVVVVGFYFITLARLSE